ncbi:MAG: DUF1697 domain-containing protein [Erysipelotrichaceae bacterium]
MRIAVFLRAVNLGPKNKVAMGDLRKTLEADGFKDVKTYLNSGNLTMSSQDGIDEDVRHIKELILNRFNVDIDVFAAAINELEEKIKRGIFGDLTEKQVPYVVFLSQKIKLELPSDLHHIRLLAQSGKLLFCVGTMSAEHTSFPNALIEQEFKIRCTSRNLNTLEKMLQAA